MKVYRIAKKKHAEDLSGGGGLFCSGRWHSQGTPVLYAASSRALALSEKLVHHAASLMPSDLVYVVLDLPIEWGDLGQLEIKDGWDSLPPGLSSQMIGTHWLKSAQSLAVKVPSVVVPAEFNILINPAHSWAERIKASVEGPCSFDRRLIDPNLRKI